MEWGAAIAAIFTLLLPLFQYWAAKKPERDAHDRTEEVQQGRKDIADGNANAVSIRIDSVREASGNTPKLGNTENTKERLIRITG